MIAGSPILLRIVAYVWRETKEIPAGRAKLYQSFFRGWFLSEKKKMELNEFGASWGEEETLRALSELAFRSRQKGITVSKRSQVCDIFSQCLDISTDIDQFTEWVTQGVILVGNEEKIKLVFGMKPYKNIYVQNIF